MRQAIFISGTGKSGTTIVAKAFFDSGMPMGLKMELSTFAGGGGNVHGVWEHEEAMNINKAILAHNGLDWYQRPEKALELSTEIEQRLRLFVDCHGDKICLKDPRFCWTAPIWAKFYDKTTIIWCFRSPVGFIQSAKNVMPELFQQRGNQDQSGLDTWMHMNTQALEQAKKFETYFFSFDDSFYRLKSNLKKLLARFQYQLNEEDFDRFYEPNAHRFSSQTVLELSGKLPAEVLRLWQSMTYKSFSPLLPFAKDNKVPWEEELEQIYWSEMSLERFYFENYQGQLAELKKIQQTLTDQQTQHADLNERYLMLKNREKSQQLLINQQAAEIGHLGQYNRRWIRWQVRLRDTLRPRGVLYEKAKALYFKLKYLGKSYLPLKGK